jgi:hypothetical protein
MQFTLSELFADSELFSLCHLTTLLDRGMVRSGAAASARAAPQVR